MSHTEVLSPEKQQQILRGAAEIFAQDGYEGASMSRIAACAGVSKGTLYNYFDSKADMFAAWVRLECNQLLHNVFDNDAPDGDPAAVLRNLGLSCVRMMVSSTGRTGVPSRGVRGEEVPRGRPRLLRRRAPPSASPASRTGCGRRPRPAGCMCRTRFSPPNNSSRSARLGSSCGGGLNC